MLLDAGGYLEQSGIVEIAAGKSSDKLPLREHLQSARAADRQWLSRSGGSGVGPL